MIKICMQGDDGQIRMVDEPRAVEIDGSPFAVAPTETDIGEIWLVVHIPTGWAASRNAWSVLFDAYSAVESWWNEVPERLRRIMRSSDTRAVDRQIPRTVIDRLFETADIELRD